MQAIILAAGMGRRLGELTGSDTKCMLEINGTKLIDRFLDAMTARSDRVERVIIVVGYKAQRVIEHVESRNYPIEIIFVENPNYATTNNIYSLNLAKEYLIDDDTLLFESDLIYEESIVDKLLDNPYPNLALVAKYESWMDGTVVKIDENSNIYSFVAKKHFDYSQIEEYYKTVNIYKFSREFSKNLYVPFMTAYLAAFGNNEYYEQVLRVLTMLDTLELKALAIGDEKWYEIDDIQDYDIASSMFAASDNDQWCSYTFRYGGYWRYPSMVDFCYLVNPYFPPQRLIDELKCNFDTLLREYPSGMGVNSMLAAKYFDVNPKLISVGNGAAELIKAYVEKHVGRLGVVFPTFEEYPNRLAEERVVAYTPQNRDFAYSAEDIMGYFDDKEVESLLIINPDNPSGNYISHSGIVALFDWSEARGINLVIDESFVDFVDSDSVPTLIVDNILERYKHLVVIKSISKSYGVPGLRLGVLASGNVELIASIKRDVAIWNINSFAEFYMQIYGKYQEEYAEACQKFKRERQLFYEELCQIPYLRVIPSQANYFMCEVIGGVNSRDLAIQLLKEHNILIKDCSGKIAFNGAQYIRVAVRDRHDNALLVERLKTVATP
ncbi:MAG: aminotransferase class I/II-fold pyridoxal phosphate-dependent enzyme [Rikenellaceae bacterium]